MVLEITGPPILVVMGVAGTGKSTVAGLLAERLNWELRKETIFIRQRMSQRCPQAFHSTIKIAGHGWTQSLLG